MRRLTHFGAIPFVRYTASFDSLVVQTTLRLTGRSIIEVLLSTCKSCSKGRQHVGHVGGGTLSFNASGPLNERPTAMAERGEIWMSNLVPFHAQNCFRFGLKQSSMTLFFVNVFPCNSGFRISHVYVVAAGVNGEEMVSATFKFYANASMYKVSYS